MVEVQLQYILDPQVVYVKRVCWLQLRLSDGQVLLILAMIVLAVVGVLWFMNHVLSRLEEDAGLVGESVKAEADVDAVQLMRNQVTASAKAYERSPTHSEVDSSNDSEEVDRRPPPRITVRASHTRVTERRIPV